MSYKTKSLELQDLKKGTVSRDFLKARNLSGFGVNEYLI